MVAPTPMPADAPVVSPELPAGVEIAVGGDSVARSVLMAFVGVAVVVEGAPVEAVVSDDDGAVEETIEEAVDDGVEVGVDVSDEGNELLFDAGELVVDSVVSDCLAYPPTVVNPTNSFVVTVPPAIRVAGPAVNALAGSSQQSKLYPASG
jgi:hypothetical protein